MNLNIGSCAMFSPNIEIKCIMGIQKIALKLLNEQINKLETSTVSKTSYNKLLGPLKNAEVAISETLIGEHEENTHHRDGNTENREKNIRESLQNVASIIETSKNDLIAEIAAEAQRQEEEFSNLDFSCPNELARTEAPITDEETESLVTNNFQSIEYNVMN